LLISPQLTTALWCDSPPRDSSMSSLVRHSHSLVWIRWLSVFCQISCVTLRSTWQTSHDS